MADPRHPTRARRMDPRVTFRLFVTLGLAVALIGALWALADGSAKAGPGGLAAADPGPKPAGVTMPEAATSLPSVQLHATPAANPCAQAGVQQALASGGDDAVVAAFGGGAAFRDAVAAGNAPCIDLADPNRDWVVVNKTRPLNPVTFAPTSFGDPALTVDGAGSLRSDTSHALDQLSAAANAAGVGSIALASGYRSYDTQVQTYSGQIAQYGQAQGDALSARPGHSEHQTGLAADVVSCAAGCGDIDSFGGTAAGAWVAANGWQYGFIVRYVAGQTPVTGYDPEPWHLRYVGVPLATAYHDGGYATLEQFFGLAAAPAYVG
ncbi:M15 family metallopeptidase [Microbacterium sp. Au-Mic1]|uniref:M15 family metallopeptidase n=1 Tax=Microbacterium sp. Au-Mic1 TaxID=2906457 RepID=UPI001E3AA7D5|nr:M15 family metallopeptidase [Microbacterium sp. Au-Mic1]MCE4027454.1 M15 family metallopeptidase [Microbacterium sp. Au-Mic1]